MSRMDLTPAQTTVTAVRPSSVKSEDTSMAAKYVHKMSSIDKFLHALMNQLQRALWQGTVKYGQEGGEISNPYFW